MKKPFLLTIMVTIITFTIAGCGLVNSDDKIKVDIVLDSQTLTDQGSITASLINRSSEDILVYEQTLSSSVQRLNDSGIWFRLFSWPVIEGEPYPFTDWYSYLNANDVYETKISYELIEYLIDTTNNSMGAGTSREIFTVNGEYRLIFELVFDEDYENKQRFYSERFTVN